MVLVFPGVNASAFSVPETLMYELSVGGVAIGNLSLEAKDAGPRIELVSTMSTDSWVSVFYPVDDHAVSYLKKTRQKDVSKTFPYIPSAYQLKLNEGPHKADMDLIFDQTRKTITCSDFIENGKTSFKIKAFTLDPLAALYYFRRVPLTPGKSVVLHVINNKVIRKIETECVRRETIKTPFGTFKTVLVRADMHFDGPGIIYYPGDVYIWLTDDERKLPIVIEKKLTALAEGKLPDFVIEKMPAYLKEKLSAGSIKATLIAQ